MPSLSNDINDAPEIVDFYADEGDDVDGWHMLIHVCQTEDGNVSSLHHHIVLSENSLHREKTSEGDAEWLASLAHHRTTIWQHEVARGGRR